MTSREHTENVSPLPAPASPESRPAVRFSGLLDGAVVAAVFASFVAYSALQAPVPGPNEPHYLCKARHYWDPDFCRGDFFLESANPHLVFYQTIGWLTLFLPLSQVAWIGRLLGYAVLAAGWSGLVRTQTRQRWTPLWAAWVFLAVVTMGNLSGEWMVGGIEAKVFSYGFLLAALAAVMQNRWRWAALLCGLAVSFHPVVGCWGIIVAGGAIGLEFFCRRRREWSASLTWPGKKEAVFSLGLLLAASLPGLIPAVSFLFSASGAEAAKANQIQIFLRLAHHLDPLRFAPVSWGDYEIPVAWVGYGFLLLFWGILYRKTREHHVGDWLAAVVLMTALVALCGLLAGWMPRDTHGFPLAETPALSLRLFVLKLYPFRLFDVFLPLAVSVGVVNLVLQQEDRAVAGSLPSPPNDCDDDFGRSRSRCLSHRRCFRNTVFFAGFLAFALLRPIPDRNPSRMPPDERRHWITACLWVREHLPANAVVLTPSTLWSSQNGWAFKWYGERAEYFSFKDCPQDAAGLLEWNRRRLFLKDWCRRFADDGYSQPELEELHRREGITHILVPETTPEGRTFFFVYGIREERFLYQPAER